MQFVFSAPWQIDLGDFSDKNMETIFCCCYCEMCEMCEGWCQFILHHAVP